MNNANQPPSAFYGGGVDPKNQSFQASPYKNNVNQQQQVIGNTDMKNDMNSLMNGIGQEAQIKMQQQLAQLVINKVYRTEEEKKKKEQDANINDDDGGESCSTMLFKRCCFFLDVEFYQPYFQFVTTSAVLKRIGYSLIPFKADFFTVADNKPDLYGPLWLSFTLVFALTASGNLSMYLQSSDQAHFSYKFSFVSSAFSMVFGYATIVPLFIAFMMKLFGSTHTFYLQTICIYGYSLFVFIPISLLCTIPYNIVQYCLFLYAAINSTFFLLNNFLSKMNELKTGEGQTDRKKIIIALIAGIQVLLMFLYKYYFFSQMYYTQSKELVGGDGDTQDIPFFQNNHSHSNNHTMQYNSTGQFFKTLHHHGNANQGHLLI